MRSFEDLLAELTEMDVKIWIEHDRLRANAPKGTMTPAIKAELAARKDEIIAFLRQTKRRSDLPSIQPRAESGPCILSTGQHRLWFLDQ